MDTENYVILESRFGRSFPILMLSSSNVYIVGGFFSLSLSSETALTVKELWKTM